MLVGKEEEEVVVVVVKIEDLVVKVEEEEAWLSQFLMKMSFLKLERNQLRK